MSSQALQSFRKPFWLAGTDAGTPACRAVLAVRRPSYEARAALIPRRHNTVKPPGSSTSRRSEAQFHSVPSGAAARAPASLVSQYAPSSMSAASTPYVLV